MGQAELGEVQGTHRLSFLCPWNPPVPSQPSVLPFPCSWSCQQSP